MPSLSMLIFRVCNCSDASGCGKWGVSAVCRSQVSQGKSTGRREEHAGLDELPECCPIHSVLSIRMPGAMSSTFIPRTMLIGMSIATATSIAQAANDFPLDVGVGLAATQFGALDAEGTTSDLAQPASLNENWAEVSPSPFPASCPKPAKKKDFKKAVAGAYKPLFYDNKFDYVLDDAYDGYHLGEEFKRRCLGSNIIWDAGGEYRMRHHSENNLRLKPLAGNDDDFLLQRTRLFLNAEVGNRVRLYAEAVDATTSGQNLRPRVIEVNRFDAINLFADAMLFEDACCDGKLYGRVGRQELLYGAQRLISPLDWSNTRRTFDGPSCFTRAATGMLTPSGHNPSHLSNTSTWRVGRTTISTDQPASKISWVFTRRTKRGRAKSPTSTIFVLPTTVGSGGMPTRMSAILTSICSPCG